MSNNNEYVLLDSGFGRKLEQVGDYLLVRPAAQAVWAPRLDKSKWSKADAEFTRNSSGDGKWDTKKKLPKEWIIKINAIEVYIRPTDFGHLGFFIEQYENWLMLDKYLDDSLLQRDFNSGFKILNLFAYTGISTLFLARDNVEVVHLDASKTSVSWGRDNSDLANMSDNKIRWIVDDVKKFVQREVNRNSKYQGIVLDPPSFGRGPKGQMWKIEDDLVNLLNDLCKLRADDFSFMLLSSHSPGYTPQSLYNIMLGLNLPKGSFKYNEMLIPEVSNTNKICRMMPAGACCFYSREV